MKLVAIALSSTAAIACAVFLSSCETDGGLGTDPLRIEPSAVTLTNTAVVVFEALGGDAPYQWTVSDSTLGTIGGTGAVVNYNSTAQKGANIVQVKDANSWTASARVDQK
ncbi:MAG: hypothetical protein FJ224_09590 [Lentisphaerae bacterium]|nr:hypothetical protein [Lentisphaerota bacterium]